MTTSSASKDNPKSGKKAVKQTTLVSSSLKTIMKYGGGGVGQKEGGKTSTDKGDKDIGSKRRQKWEAAIGDKERSNFINERGDIEMSSKADKNIVDGNEVDPLQKEDDVEMLDTNGSTYVSTERKWDDTIGTMDINSTPADVIRHWEATVVQMEKEMGLDTTPEGKKLIEVQLLEAQRKLKQAILRMSVPHEQVSANPKDNGTNNYEKVDEEMDKGEIEKSDEVFIVESNPTTSVQDKMKDQDTNKKRAVLDSHQGIKTYAWGDDSDDETVVLQNQMEKNTSEWQMVTNKTPLKNKNLATNSRLTANPYATTNKTINSANNNGNTTNNGKSSLVSFLEVTQGKMRSKNEHSIRINLSFTPRTAGSGEYMRIANEILSFGKEIDDNILILPWCEHQDIGPINSDDLANPKNLGNTIKKYFDKPPHVNWQPGSPVYGIGMQLSTKLKRHEFMDRWNLKKQEYKQNNRAAHSISLAPVQKSSSAYIIGIAVGSTEKQDTENLNARLGEATGIEGIEASFQSINQFGVTQEFWKLANDKASAINKDKFSRAHLREKYKWAPNALAIYVPKKELVSKARKLMINKYGKAVDGTDPVWPDGSSMRFLPIKGSTIKNDKTRNIVRKRLAYHIWLKVNESTIDTNMVNIHHSIGSFGDMTFAQIVLGTVNDENQRIFSHFNRVWSNDPSQERWALSVKYQHQESAQKIFNNLRDDLFDKYGEEIEYFFLNKRINSQWKDAVTNRQQMDEEEDWFDDDDDIDEVVKKGLVDSTFLKFFTNSKLETNDDKQSVASWGTGNTAYTEIVTTQETTSTVDSSITQESPKLSDEEIAKKKDIVRVRLLIKGIQDEEVEDILANKAPYDLAFSGIQLKSWDPDKEIFMLLAIREQFKHNHNKNDDDE
jgi:hypothetical protein